jgi:hypothetical protein
VLARPAIRLRRWLAAIGLIVVLLSGAAVAVLRIRFEGPDLADTLTTLMNKNMSGRITARSVEWPITGLAAVVRGGWVPVDIKDVQIHDSDGVLVVTTPRLTAEIDLHALMFGRHDFVLRKIRVHGGRVLLREIAEPKPLHAYDKKVFSLLAAFYGKTKGGYHAGITASKKPVFDLRDFSIENVDLEIWSARKSANKYGFRALVADVSAKGFLYMDPDPLVPKFYFSLEPRGGPGELDIPWQREADGEWRGGYRFPVRELRVNALKQIPSTWPVSPVANTLRFDLELDLSHSGDTELTKAAIKGSMVDYWDTPYGGSWQLNATMTNAGQTLKESVLIDLGGDDVKVAAEITGSIVYYPRIQLAISGLTYDLRDFAPPDPETGIRPSIILALDDLNASYDLAVNHGRVDAFRASGLGGELRIKASFDGDGTNEAPFIVDAKIDITKPIELSPWLAPCQQRILGSRLGGSFHVSRAKGDTEVIATLDKIDLQIGKVEAKDGTVFADQSFGTIEIKDVRVRYGDTSATVGVTFDPRVLTMPPFEITEIRGRVGTLRRLQQSLSCHKPPAPRLQAPRPTYQGRPAPARGPGRRASTRPSVRPRPRVAVAARPRSFRHAQRSSFDDIHIESEGGVRHVAGGVIIGGPTKFLDVPIVETATVAGFQYEEPRLTVTRATLPGLGGSTVANGVIRLGPTAWIERLQITAKDVDLARLKLAKKLVTGKVSGGVTLRGPTDPLRMIAKGALCSARLTVLGEAFTDVGVWLGQAPATIKGCASIKPPTDAADRDRACLDVQDRGGRCVIATVQRAGGGALTARVAADRQEALGGTLSVTALPLSALAALSGATWPAGAILDAPALTLGGTVDAPTVAGTIRVSRLWALDAYLGDGELVVAPDGGGLQVEGSFLDGRLAIRGRIATAPPYRLDLTVDASRVPLDGFVDLAKLLGVPSARASGSFRVRVRTVLGQPNAPLDVDLELSDLVATIAIPGLGDGPLPVDLRLAAPVAATYDGATLQLTQPAVLATPLGSIAVIGAAGAHALDLTARGTLDIARALPLAGDRLDDARGKVELAVRVTGTAAAPRLRGTLAIADVGLRPARQDAWLRLPEGKIEIDDATGAAAGPGRRTLSFTGLGLEVDDGYSSDPAKLSISGGVVLDGAQPAEWNVIVLGALGGEMLALAAAFVAPGELTQASGAADVGLRLTGVGPRPIIDGAITFEAGRPLTLFARRARREVALGEGTITIVNDPDVRDAITIELDGVGGTLDGEGRLRELRGAIDLRGGRLAAADISASLEAFPYRVPRQLDLVVDAEVRGVINGDELELSGAVAVVNGRYLVDLKFGDLVKPDTPGQSAPPFWAESPLLANARLEVDVDVRRFSVTNNVATIDLEGDLKLSGSPRDPRFGGAILVQRGSFRIPGLRPRFTRTTGTITFEQSLPLGQTPTLDLTSEADYRDPSGREHAITLLLFDRWANVQWDLSTADGLNKTQTLTLLLAGRTPDEFRRGLGQPTIGADPTRINPSTDESQGYFDELIRQSAGELLGSTISEPLRDLSQLDVARIEFNLGSLGFHGEKRVTENFQVIGDLERTTAGSTVNGRAEYRVFSFAYAEGSFLTKDYDDAAERDVTEYELKAVFRTTLRWGPW